MAEPAFSPTDEQRVAIEHPLLPLFLVAGAGAGKTSVIAERVLWVVEQSRARPDQILASRREVGEPVRISLTRSLARRPAEISELLLVTPGARLDPDQPIARSPDGREVRSPGPS